MSTITKERLEQLANFRGAPVTRQEEQELARIALASLEAEPVAYMYKDNLHADARFSLHTRFGNWSKEDINEYEITEIPLYSAPPAPVSVPDGYRLQPISEYDAMCAAMLQGDEPVSQSDAIDANLVEALRFVQCMLEDYRERNYGDAERWIRHIDTHMSAYTESHGEDAYSILHDLLPAAPQQEVTQALAKGMERYGDAMQKLADSGD